MTHTSAILLAAALGAGATLAFERLPGLLERSRDAARLHASGQPELDPTSALFDAAIRGSTADIQLALERGAFINAINADPSRDLPMGATPLIAAARFGQRDAAAYLLARGALASARTQQGFTALHLASFHGHAGVVATLLQHPEIETAPIGRGGLTPLALAGSHDQVRSLLAPTPDAPTSPNNADAAQASAHQ